MNEAAIKAQNLVYRAAEPFEPNDTPGDQVYRAHRRLRGHQMPSGWSRVRRAYYGQAGEPTWLALKAQAEKVGIPVPEGLKCNTTETPRSLLTNLKAAMHTLWQRHNDPNHPEIIALQWAVNQLEGRE